MRRLFSDLLHGDSLSVSVSQTVEMQQKAEMGLWKPLQSVVESVRGE